MGNEASSRSIDFEVPPEVLEGRDIRSLAKYIKSDECKNIFVMVCRYFADQTISSTEDLFMKLGAGRINYATGTTIYREL